MVKVKMKVSMAATNFSYAPDDVVEVEQYVADVWVKNDIADLVEEPKKKTPLKKGDE